MGEGKHTPGEWIIAHDDFDDALHITTQQRLDGRVVPIAAVTTGYTGPVGEEQEANASLIAAAPDLLEALTEARTTLSILRTQVMVEIRLCADPSESRWEGVPDKLKERLDDICAAIQRATAPMQEGE